MKTFKNTNYDRKASYECTILIYCQSEVAPSEHWIECHSEEINVPHLYTQAGVRYFGRL